MLYQIDNRILQLSSFGSFLIIKRYIDNYIIKSNINIKMDSNWKYISTNKYEIEEILK